MSARSASDLVAASYAELDEKGVSDVIFALQSPFLGVCGAVPKLIKALQPKFKQRGLFIDDTGAVWPIEGSDSKIIGIEFGDHGAFWPNPEMWLKDTGKKLLPTDSKPQAVGYGGGSGLDDAGKNSGDRKKGKKGGKKGKNKDSDDEDDD